MKLIDSHAHLTDEKFDNVEEILKNAKESGIEKIVCSAYNLSSSDEATKLAEKYENVFSNVGLHPENVEEFSEEYFEKLKKLYKSPKVVAVGEIGLDYHFTTENKDLQKQIFERQLLLANKLNLPAVIHSRDAMGDTIEILKKVRLKRESLLHCFSGSYESAKILIELGFSFSFGGVVTFNNAKNVVEVVKNLPIEKILIETDCPYMTPVPFRGQRNEPKNIVYIADAISRIKGMTIEEVAEITTKNAERLFKI